MYSGQQNAKVQAEKKYYDRIQGTALCDSLINMACESPQTPRSTPQQDAERNHQYHAEMAQKLGEAAKFLSLHSEFSRFIELVRQGAIQF